MAFCCHRAGLVCHITSNNGTSCGPFYHNDSMDRPGNPAMLPQAPYVQGRDTANFRTGKSCCAAHCDICQGGGDNCPDWATHVHFGGYNHQTSPVLIVHWRRRGQLVDTLHQMCPAVATSPNVTRWTLGHAGKYPWPTCRPSAAFPTQVAAT